MAGSGHYHCVSHMDSLALTQSKVVLPADNLCLPLHLLVILPAQASYLAMSHVGGKLLLFQAGLPSLGAGKVKPSRENLSLYNTDRESTLRNPEDPFFKKFAGEASSRQITLDIFCGANGYTDLASLSSIAKYTCGQVGGSMLAAVACPQARP